MMLERAGIIYSKGENSRSMLWARKRSAMVRESYPRIRATLIASVRRIDSFVAAL